MAEEKFEFSSRLKKRLIGYGVAGLVLLIIGIILLLMGGGHHAEGHEAASAGAHEFHWYQRLYANLWINNVYFTGISLIGVFFIAVNYVSHAGWSAVLKRVPEAFGSWLPFAGVLMLLVFIVAHHDLFHWTHSYLYDETDPRYDAIIAGKEGYLNLPFYIGRMIAYFVIWYLLFRLLRKESLNEDLEGGTAHYHKSVKYSAIFLVLFAVTSSTSAWDWILSIDTHWFSTMIGWYVFASWFVTGLAAITLTVILLRENGYLKLVTSEHLHDLGKFIFAFSIFWTYIWFSQFMLIYYANMPEETIYFVERLSSDQYAPVFFINLILNFFFPFLVLMTRDSKRHTVFLKLVCAIVLIGHWLDFYLMVVPGTLKENGGFGFMEIGLAMVYGVAFVFVVLTNMSKASLVAVKHPMLGESTHHHT